MTQCELSSTDSNFCTQLGDTFEEDIILLPFTNCFKKVNCFDLFMCRI